MYDKDNLKKKEDITFITAYCTPLYLWLYITPFKRVLKNIYAVSNYKSTQQEFENNNQFYEFFTLSHAFQIKNSHL